MAGVVIGFMGVSQMAHHSIEAFRMPSGSMAPTFFIGDHFMVGKRNVLPSSRGKVVAFVYPFSAPNTESHTFVKRVVGIPGDTLEFDAGHPIINGWHVPECKVGAYAVEEPGSVLPGELFVEFLGEEAYLVWYQDDYPHNFEGPFHVEPDETWVLGDNRHNSSDSRRWRAGQGAGVPDDYIVGRTLFIWMSEHPGRFGAALDAASLAKSFPDHIATGIQECLNQRPSQTLPPAKPATVQP
jgi:signal peptidase I